jgi:hypothetical protein
MSTFLLIFKASFFTIFNFHMPTPIIMVQVM